MERAVNPQTGEVVFLVNNQWVKPTQTARNPKTGEMAYLVGNSWQIAQAVPMGEVEGAAPTSPEELLTPITETPEETALKEKTKKYEAGTTMAERAKRDLERGVIALQKMPAELQVSSIQKEIERIRSGLGGRTDTMTGEFIPMSPEEEAAAIAALQARQAEALKEVQKRQAEMRAIPGRPVTEAISEAKTFGEAMKALSTDPLGAMAGFSLESLPQMAPALVAGAVTRRPEIAALGMGGTSFTSELSNSVFEYLQDNGVDINDSEAVLKALDDPKMFKEAYDFALKRGAIIGTLDAASAGLASKALIPKKLIGSAKAREAVNIAIAQPASQIISGAGGEAAAQLATYGEIKKPGAVVGEAIAGGPTSLAETAAFGGRRIYEEFRSKEAEAPEVEAAKPPAKKVEERVEPTIEPEAKEEAPKEIKPAFAEEEIEGEETPALKLPESPAVVADQVEMKRLEGELAKVQARQMDPMLSLDDPRLGDFQRQESEIKAKLAELRGEATDIGDLYDQLVAATPAELKKIDVPLNRARELYIRLTEDQMAGRIEENKPLETKLNKLVNKLGPEETPELKAKPPKAEAAPAAPAAIKPTKLTKDEQAAINRERQAKKQAAIKAPEAPVVEPIAELTVPYAKYRPSDSFVFDGRNWKVTAVSHTGKNITASTTDRGGFRKEKFNVEPTPVEVKPTEPAVKTVREDDENSFIKNYQSLPKDQRIERKQMVKDLIETKKQNKQDASILESRLGLMEAIDSGQEIDKNAIYSKVVLGHPQFDGPVFARNLIPIKVSSVESISNKIDFVNNLYSKNLSEYRKAEYELSIAKNAKQKTEANQKLKNLRNQGIDLDLLNDIKNETLPELQRLYKESVKKFGEPAVAPVATKSTVELKKPTAVAVEERSAVNRERQEAQREIAENAKRELEIGKIGGELDGPIKTINKFKVYKVKLSPSETTWRVQSPFNRAMNRIGEGDSFHSDMTNAKAKAQGEEPLTPEQFSNYKKARKAAEQLPPVTPAATVKVEEVPAAEAKKEEHVEAGESEPITKPVIQEAVTKGADKKDIDYTAMRREVERQVDEAIAKSPYETEKDWDATYKSRQNFVTFDIPGDGKFKIKNNKERLQEFKKRLMAAVKPKQARGPQFAISPADVNTTLRDLVDANEIQAAIEFAELKGIKISESKLDLKQKLKVQEYQKDPEAFEKKAEAEAALTEAQRQAMAEAEEKRRIETNKRLAEEQEKREQDWVNARYQDLKTGSQRTIKEVLRVITKDGANKILDKIDISGEVFPEEIIEALQKKAGTYVETRWKEFVNKIDSPLEIARVTKKLFEKYSTKEGSIPLHKLVEKEVDGGSTIITMDSGERRLGDAAGYLSEKKIGTVGMDYAGFLLSRKPKGKKEIPLENISLAQIDRNLPGAKKRLPPGRSPELTAAAAQVKDGTMSAAEYDELVNKYKPIPVYTEAMKPATPEQVFDALDVAKRDKINPKIANGTPVGLRLDIPAFNRKGVFVVSIHKKRTPSAAGPVIGYGSVAKVTDATFGLGKETKALDIAAGASKDVLQTIEGKWNNISPEQAYKEAQEAINNPEWVQIGIDPTRHSYFYDRRTTLPIVKADEVIQIGNMLLGKGVEFGKKEDFLYNIESGPQLTERVIFEGISNARKQQLDELGRLARKKSELIKKIRNYGSDIETQRLLNELQDQIKIYRSGTAAKEPVTSAETFLKHARDAIDGTGMFREKSLDPEVFAVIQAAYIKTPWVLEGLRLSIKTPKQEGRASGIFIPMDRIVRLYRGTEGVEDPNTVRHELMHSLEQMMTGGAKDAVIQAWAKAFERAIKKYTDKKSQEYFKRVMDFLETPSAENRDKATEALPSYELYQYINPSEYWAVNAEKLYASQLGTAWDRFKKAIKKLFEGLKSVFGFNNTYAVHKLFDQIMGSAPGRMNRSSLTDYLLAGKAKIDFLENVQDDQKLIDKYKRPQTPMLNTEPVKNFVVNQARFAKAFFKDAVANPVEAIDTLFNGMSRGVHYLRNKNIFMGAGLEVADQEKYGGMLRNSQGLAIASVALDNALHSPNIATQVIFRGGIKFNKKAGVFVAAKNDTDTSMLGVYKAEAKLKEKLGAQLGTDIIQGYLEAKRSRSIKEELAVRDQELENLRNQLDSMDPADPDYENVRNQVNQAVDDLLAIKKAADKINMSDEEIDEFIAREKVHPELREIMDNFTGTNQNLLKFWYQVGLLSEGRYKALSKIKDYVPWYRIMDDEEDIHSPVQSTTRSMTNIGKEKLFKSGKPKTVVDFVAEDNQTEFRIQPSSVVKVKVNGVEVQNYTANAKGEIKFSQPLAQGDVVVIETAREIENMIDNMTRNVMRMTMNGLRQYASTRIVQEYASRNEKNKIMVFPKADRNKGRFDYIANGRRVVVEIKDPLVAEAIFGMENIGLETFKAFAAVANMTRRMITMNPLFQVKQVFKDGPSAAFITGVKNPYGMVADVYTSFIKALKGDDETVDILRAAGIGGFQSPTRTPEAEIKRKIGVINKSNYDIVMAALDQFGDSSDVAQRKAIYDRVMKETGDEMRAIYQASTIMPFHRHGSGRVAQAIIKTVPFMGAYANSIDVLARALIGGNIKGMNRKKAMKYLGGAFIALSSVSLLYAFVAGLDDDYWELDDQTRLRNVILPFSKKLTGEMIMMPMNTGAAFIFKAIPELIYNYVITKGTDKQIDKSRAAKAFGEAAIDSLLGPEPIPSAVKPIIEIGLNRNFFTGREMTPKGMEDLEAADQFTAATSELGKMMGSVTDKLNPIEADHLIRSIFGTVGAMVQWGSNLIFAASRPEMTIKELPVTGAFVAPKYPRGKEDLFYDFLERTRKKHATFTDRLDRMDVDSAVDYMEKNAGLIVLYDYASQLEAELKEINKDIRLYSRASQDLGLTSKERREIIDGLNTIKRGKLEGIEIFRNLSEEIKVTE